MQTKPTLPERRSPRISVRVPVVVSESVSNNKLVVEHTHTIAINRHGGLIALHVDAALGQTILLTNETTRQSKECRVVYLGPIQSDKRQVGIEFSDPEADFWETGSPPLASQPVSD